MCKSKKVYVCYKNNFYKKDLIAVRIKSIISRSDLSLSQFASKLINKNKKKLPKSTLNSYVRGLAVPPISILEQIAEIGNTTVNWIYTGKE